MAGIAVCIGDRAFTPSVSSLTPSLSLTGEETVREFQGDRIAAVSVSHSDSSGFLLSSGDILLLLDGHVYGVEGGAGGRPGEPVGATDLLRELAGAGPGVLEKLNGSFAGVLVNLRSGRIEGFTDRLGSRQLFYSRRGGMFGAASTAGALEAMGMDPFSRLRLAGLAQLLTFGRIFDDGTLWEGVFTLAGGHRLTFQGGELQVFPYHLKRFTYDGASRRSEEDNSLVLSRALEASVRRVAPGTGAGLLLSGGLDSRSVLACSPPSTVGLTVGDRDNREVRTARVLCEKAGSRHETIYRSPYHYIDMLEPASEACEGAFDYQHDHFEGLYDSMRRAGVTVILHGFAIDALARGLYLPKRKLRLRGLNVGLPALRQVPIEEAPADLIREFAITDPEALPVVREVKSQCSSSVAEAVSAFVDRAGERIVSPCDLYELFVFDTVSRWRTFPFLLGARRWMEERGVYGDNGLVDACLAVPPEQRVGSRVLRRALTRMDPRLARVLDANDMLPASLHPDWRLYAAWMLGLSVMRKSAGVYRGRRNRGAGPPPWVFTRGSWPDLIAVWRLSDIGRRLEMLLSDGRATRDGLIDTGAVRRLLAEHRRGLANNTNILSTVATFLSWRARH